MFTWRTAKVNTRQYSPANWIGVFLRMFTYCLRDEHLNYMPSSTHLPENSETSKRNFCGCLHYTCETNTQSPCRVVLICRNFGDASQVLLSGRHVILLLEWWRNIKLLQAVYVSVRRLSIPKCYELWHKRAGATALISLIYFSVLVWIPWKCTQKI